MYAKHQGPTHRQKYHIIASQKWLKENTGNGNLCCMPYALVL